MLILTVKLDGSVMLEYADGTVAWCKVLGVERDRVKLGFDAPASVTILRGELAEREEHACDKPA